MSFRWINQNGWFWNILSYCSNILCNETEFIFVTIQNMILPTSLMLAAIWVSLPTVSTWGQSCPLLWHVLSSSRHDVAAAVLIKAGVVIHRRPHRMGLWTLPDGIGESGQKLPRDGSYFLAPSPKLYVVLPCVTSPRGARICTREKVKWPGNLSAQFS